MGQVDLVVYSLAAPVRRMADGSVFRSCIKPIGEAFEGKTIDFNTGQLRDISLQPANPEEVSDTIRVMGGEDWELWIGALKDRCLLY